MYPRPSEPVVRGSNPGEPPQILYLHYLLQWFDVLITMVQMIVFFNVFNPPDDVPLSLISILLSENKFNKEVTLG